MSALFLPDFFGFYGKLPVRGDFLQRGLPGDCVKSLDGWACISLAAARAGLADEWVTFWMQTPVWKFRLAGSICGATPLIGMMIPSMDKAKRCFPLFLIAGAEDERRLDWGGAWLDAAELAGIAAVTGDLPADELQSRLAASRGRTGILPVRSAPSLWWTEGAPYREVWYFSDPAMPSQDAFASMLSDRSTATRMGMP
jgi:type VI secretion system protein ImpM